MKTKFELWTINYITNEGVHSFIECESPMEVELELEELSKSNQNMDYVNIFPPKSNITFSELNLKKYCK